MSKESMVPLIKDVVEKFRPSLLFIQEKGERLPRMYQDGKELRGVRSITIRSSYDSETTHEIEIVTGCTD
ncbi:hypothetical protein AB4Z17_08540 [Paenibacillus sp. TAF43_2]|uniref:hypothetical protein n=1 Tax=Paenibacillus sp. TAF43_2 TaxID=3233069 RepID=UPI003F98160B